MPGRCIWSDGTPFTGRAPPVACPANVSAESPFCGGTCGEVMCPSFMAENGLCMGVSSERAFGVCAAISIPCEQRFAEALLADGQIPGRREPMACLVPTPQIARAAPFGFVVTKAACLVYRAQFPTSVSCRDSTWSEIP